MHFKKMRKILLIVPILMSCFSFKVFAQSEYPTKPITFIVPYGAGRLKKPSNWTTTKHAS